MSTIKTPHNSSDSLVLHADGTGGEVHFKIGSDIIDSNTGAVTTPAPIKGKVDEVGFIGDGSQLTGITVDSNEASRRNLIDNGSMMIWERSRSNRNNWAEVTTGTDALGRSFNMLDRFETNPSNKTGLIQKVRRKGDGGSEDHDSPYPYREWLELADVSGSAFLDGDVMLRHTIENSKYNLADREFTLSFWMRQTDATNDRNLKAVMKYNGHGTPAFDEFLDEESTSNFTLKRYGDGGNVDGWARYSFTFTRPSTDFGGSGDYNFDIFEIVYADSGTTNLHNTAYGIAGIQLEKGPIATEFIDTSYTEELVKCQRFFQYRSISNWQYRYGDDQRQDSGSAAISAIYNPGQHHINSHQTTNRFRFSWELPTEMASTPTLELQWQINNANTGETFSGVDGYEFNRQSFGVIVDGASISSLHPGSATATYFLDIRYWKLDAEPPLAP